MKVKLLFLLVVFGFFAFTPKPDPKAVTAKTDEMLLLELALKKGLVEDGNKVEDYDLLRDKDDVFVNRNVATSLTGDDGETMYSLDRFPNRVGKVKIKPLTPEELQLKANAEGDFLYIEVGNIKIEGNYAEVGLQTAWAVAKSTKNKVYTSGGGYLLAYEKVNGKWQFKKVVRSWVS